MLIQYEHENSCFQNYLSSSLRVFNISAVNSTIQDGPEISQYHIIKMYLIVKPANEIRFFVKYNKQTSTLMLSLSYKYSVCDLIRIVHA